MHQIIQSYRTGKMELAEVPTPVCDDNGLLVRTAWSLVSAGTEKMLVDLAKKSLVGKAVARPDLARQVLNKMKKEGVKQTLEKVFTKLDNPIPLGYSCAGQVIEVGRNVTRFAKGDWVACGGAGYANHADVNYVPQNLAVKLPEGLDPETASFATVGSIAMQGVRQAEVELGHRVAVVGLGLLGQLTVQILKASGAKVMCMDIAEDKMKLAQELGADWVVHTDNFASKAKNVSDGHGLDAVILTASTASNQPVELAGEVCRYKGKVVVVGMVGMNIPRNVYYKKELDLRLSMSYGPGRYDAQYEEKGIDYPYSLVRWTENRNMLTFLELCAEGKVTPGKLITHRFPFAEAMNAYELFEGKTNEPYLGILLQYDMEKKLPDSITLPLSSGHGRTGSVPENESASERSGTLRNGLTDHGGTKSDAKAKVNDRLHIGLIGAGNFAKGVLLPKLSKMKDVDLEAISTATGYSAKGTATKYGIGKIYSDAGKLIDDGSINTLLITTRHDKHASMVQAGLEQGKHVFVEKPLCIREIELTKIKDAYQSLPEPPVLMVGFNRRFSPHMLKIREWIENSDERPVIRYRVNAGIIPKDTWIQDPEIGGGRIVGEVCHFIDTCSFLADSPVVDVYACLLESPGEYTQDNVCVILKHANGARSSIDYLANGDSALPKEMIEVFCGRGIAVCDDFFVTRFHKNGKQRKFKSSGVSKGFTEELAAFRDAVLAKAPTPIPFASLVNTTLCTFRILESITTNSVCSVSK